MAKAYLKGAAALSVGALAVLVAVLKGPPNSLSVELLDLLDRQLDKAQGSLAYNLQENQYFQGIFAPTTEEVVDGPGLKLELLEGRLPKSLGGVFLRIGPNAWATPTKRHHVFDGDGMLHTVRLRDGEAFYHNAWLQTPRLQFEQSRGAAYFSRIGELHGKIGLVKALVMMNQKTKAAGLRKAAAGQANTAMAALPDGRLWALHEGSVPFEFRLDEQGCVLSVGHEFMDNNLTDTMSAHPKVDVQRREALFHGYSSDGGADGKSFLRFGRVSGEGKLESHFVLNATGASFSHDLVLTEGHVVIIDSSVRFNPKKIVKGGSPFSFDKDHSARLAVVPRGATSLEEVRWFEAPKPLTWVHPLHGWEEEDGGVLVIWAPLGFETNRTNAILEGCCDTWHMTEMRFDLRTNEMSMEVIDPLGEHHGEFSRMRDDLYGSGFARFGYTGLVNQSSDEEFDFIGLAKWDMKKKKFEKEIHYPKGWIGGEPIFLPNPDASGDPSDDGWVATFLFGPHEDSSDLVLYNARSFSSKPVARLRVPKRVPVGFHGGWLSEEGLRQHLARTAAQ